MTRRELVREQIACALCTTQTRIHTGETRGATVMSAQIEATSMGMIYLPELRMPDCTRRESRICSVCVRDVIEAYQRHVAARDPECTGIAAGWCPNCGDCTCDRSTWETSPEHNTQCPLHGENSTHAGRLLQEESAA